MLFDIFSGFDDHNFVLMDLFYLVWVVLFVVLISLLLSFWCGFGVFFSFLMVLFSVVGGLISRSAGKMLGGSVSLFCSLFLMLVCLNVFGLVPYVFSVTSHLAINLSVSLPLWFSIILMSVMYDLGGFLSHLQPMGSPALLNPFLCLIELVSNFVRPITLSVRLTANLSTGHILMSLLGLGFVSGGLFVGVLIFFVGMFYFMFELGVCFVQGYIFSLLPTLYADEHPSDAH